MMNGNKAYHSSNLNEENLRNSKKTTNLSNKKLKRNENSIGIAYTEPSPYEDSEKNTKYRGIPSSNPLEKPHKDVHKLAEMVNPTENPAFYLKEYFFSFSQKMRFF